MVTMMGGEASRVFHYVKGGLHAERGCDTIDAQGDLIILTDQNQGVAFLGHWYYIPVIPLVKHNIHKYHFPSLPKSKAASPLHSPVSAALRDRTRH
jgi:hypothetical protein